jgi:hypothetical protein
MSMQKKWQLSRRTFLRGAGAAIALPALYQMRPSTARAEDPAKPVRLVTIVMPHGLPQGSNGGSGQGTTYELPDYEGSNMLAPLDPYRDDFLNLAGLSRARPQGLVGDHPVGFAQILTCHPFEMKSGTNVPADTTPTLTSSYDQLAAAHFAPDYPWLPSLSIAVESQYFVEHSSTPDGIERAIGSYLSWNGPTPVAPLLDIGKIFDKIFGGFDPGLSEAQRAELRRQGKSVLDFVVTDIGRLGGRLGKDDRATMERYLESIRSLETRIASSEALACEPGERPTHSESYPERLDQVIDLTILAMKCDATRVITINLGDLYSGLVMSSFAPGTSSTQDLHSMSHSNPAAHAEAVRWFASKYASLIAKLKAEPDIDGTLLDNSLVLMTSEIGRGNDHYAGDLPVFLAGRGGGAINTGRRVEYYDETPIAKLYIALLQTLGLTIDEFKGVTGALSGLT